MNTKELLLKGVKDGVYPGAVLVAGVCGKMLMHYSVGYLQKIPKPYPMKNETIFDIASLTKPLATSLAIMKLVQEGVVDLDMPISKVIKAPKEKESITIKMLLSHCSGLPDWRPYYLRLSRYPLKERTGKVVKWILEERLCFKPGKDELYSDLGFILLKYIVEKIADIQLKEIAEGLYRNFGLKNTFFGISKKKIRREDFAAMEFCKWRRRVIQGEVHDENAFALGGYSGHSGLFSTVEDVFIISNILLEHYLGKRQDLFNKEIIREFFRRQNKRWALGWDTPTFKSSSGSLFSKRSVGHLGFTGCSLWIDLEKELIVVFLTNRIHLSRENQKIKKFRPALHDCIVKEFKPIL